MYNNAVYMYMVHAEWDQPVWPFWWNDIMSFLNKSKYGFQWWKLLHVILTRCAAGLFNSLKYFWTDISKRLLNGKTLSDWALVFEDDHDNLCIQSSAVITRSNIIRYYINITENKSEYQSFSGYTNDTPCLTLTNELWSVFCEYLGENCLCYIGTALYSRISSVNDYRLWKQTQDKRIAAYEEFIHIIIITECKKY